MMIVIVLACTLVAYHIYWFAYTQPVRDKFWSVEEFRKQYFIGTGANIVFYILLFALAPIWLIALVVAVTVGSLPFQKKLVAKHMN